MPASSTTAGQTGLRNIYGTPLNLTGYNPTGSDFTSTVTITHLAEPGGARSAGAHAGITPINDAAAATDPPARRPTIRPWPPAPTATTWSSGRASSTGRPTSWASCSRPTARRSGRNSPRTAALDLLGQPGRGHGPPTAISSSPGRAPDRIPTRRPTHRTSSRGDTTTRARRSGLSSRWTSTAPARRSSRRCRTSPAIAVAPDGTFVIAWTLNPITVSNQNTQNSVIDAREYNADGVPVNAPATAAFQPNGSRFPGQRQLGHRPEPAGRGDGRQRRLRGRLGRRPTNSSWGVYGDYFTNSGCRPAGPRDDVHRPDTAEQHAEHARAVSRAQGSSTCTTRGRASAWILPAAFVVTWADYTNRQYNIFAQQFAAGGKAAAIPSWSTTSPGPTLVGWQLMPAVGVDAEGISRLSGQATARTIPKSGTSRSLDYGIYARMYNANGTPLAIAPTRVPRERHDFGQPGRPALPATIRRTTRSSPGSGRTRRPPARPPSISAMSIRLLPVRPSQRRPPFPSATRLSRWAPRPPRPCSP